MGYKHGATQTTAAPALSVEQIRRRNHGLLIELAKLKAEQAQLEPQVEAMRRDVTAARKKLTRQIQMLDATLTQASEIAIATANATPSTQGYGGREGLQAAADEIKNHEYQGLKLTKAKRGTGPSHGTARRFEAGCKCDPCRAAKKAKSARYRTNLKRRLGTL